MFETQLEEISLLVHFSGRSTEISFKGFDLVKSRSPPYEGQNPQVIGASKTARRDLADDAKKQNILLRF